MQTKRALSAVVLGVLATTPARAYTYQSAVSKGCHERITADALRALRLADGVPAVTPSANDRALIRDLPFDLEPDVRDLTGAALAVGARDNDLHGNGPNELDAVAQLHGDPRLQREHCLRGTLDDEPQGTQQALEQCKAFLREKVSAALEGLDQNGRPDPVRRATLEVTLAFRRRTDVELPVYWIEMGRALHAMQDSFTHTFRSPDHRRVRVTTNYTDYVNRAFDESRDGPAHRSEMDECEDLDAYRAQNLELAKQASVELLRLTVDPNLATREAKMAALETTLHAYLDHEPGCTSANAWCGAPENDYGVDAGCALAPGERTRSAPGSVLALAAAALAFVRRRRRLVALTLAAASVAWPSQARAEEPACPAPAPTPAEVRAAERNEEHEASRFALYGAVTGSLSNPSLNGQLGGRVRVAERWQLGLDGELNNWYGSTTKRFATAALNIYGTVVFRTPLRFAAVNLRTVGNLGTSTLLIDLYGAPSGTTGLFLGFAPMGIEWKVSSRVFLVVHGLSVALPIPKLGGSGAPFAYTQYRTTLAVEFAL